MVEYKIIKEEYHTNGRTTVCILTMMNGFQITGSTYVSEDAKFNKNKGETLAKRDALRKAADYDHYSDSNLKDVSEIELMKYLFYALTAKEGIKPEQVIKILQLFKVQEVSVNPHLGFVILVSEDSFCEVDVISDGTSINKCVEELMIKAVRTLIRTYL